MRLAAWVALALAGCSSSPPARPSPPPGDLFRETTRNQVWLCFLAPDGTRLAGLPDHAAAGFRFDSGEDGAIRSAQVMGGNFPTPSIAACLEEGLAGWKAAKGRVAGMLGRVLIDFAPDGSLAYTVECNGGFRLTGFVHKGRQERK